MHASTGSGDEPHGMREDASGQPTPACSTPWLRVAAVLLVLLASEPALAGVFTPVSQSREVQADDHDVTIGYACIGFIAGHPVPACPIELENVVQSDVETAPGFVPDPFVAAPGVTGASASHTSSIQPEAIVLSGAGSSQGAAAELPLQPGYVLVLQTADRSTRDDSTITVELDEPTPFSFEASGRIVHPDPGIPVSWDVEVQIALAGPGGSVASLSILPDPGCPTGDSGTFTCWVEPAPVVVTGTLPAGQYALQVLATTRGDGSWYPSVGALSGFATAEYSASLSLGAAPPVPGLGPFALAGLAATLAAGVFWLNSGRCLTE